MSTEHYILMADVIDSGSHPGDRLGRHLERGAEAANTEFAERLRSPLTVTLGDEFQGICASLEAGIDLILWWEHWLRRSPLEGLEGVEPYALRFVLLQGEVESPINPERAHGMLGPGLTEARELLDAHRRGEARIRVRLNEAGRAQQLEGLFAVLDALTEDFQPGDFAFIEALFEEADNRVVGERFKRHRTSVDRRRRTLKIEAYQTLERLLRSLATN